MTGDAVSFGMTERKVEPAQPLLSGLQDREVRGELGSLHRGKLNRLRAQCLMTMSPHAATKDYILTIALNAYRALITLCSRFESTEGSAPRTTSSGHYFTPWVVTAELLEATLTLGRMYRYVGDAKRAKCYLKDGLTVSRKFGLLKWCTVFGVEVSEVLFDTQSLQPMVSMLTATYTTLSTLEPPTTPLSSPSSHLPNTKTRCRHSAPSQGHEVMAEDLVRECLRVYDSGRVQMYCAWYQGQVQTHPGQAEGSQQGSGGRFWQKLQSYTKMEEQKHSQVHRDIVQLGSFIMAWTASLATHPPNCWCSMCTDSESQRLALTLAMTSLKIIHANATTDLHLEWFVKKVLRRLKQQDPGQRVAQVLGLEGGVVRCRDVVLMKAAEMSVLLVECSLHQKNFAQGLAHVRTGLKVLDTLPSHCPEAWMVRLRLTHFHVLCAFYSMYHHPHRQADFSHRQVDSSQWCWLTDSQLEVQIRNQLEQLKIKGSQRRKVDKAPCGDEWQCPVSQKGPTENGNNTSTPTESKVSPPDRCMSSHSLSGMESSKDSEKSSQLEECQRKEFKSSGKASLKDWKKLSSESVNSSDTFTDKDVTDNSPSSQEESSLTHSDSEERTPSQSADEQRETNSHHLTDKAATMDAESYTVSKKSSVPQLSSQTCQSVQSQRSGSLSPTPVPPKSHPSLKPGMNRHNNPHSSSVKPSQTADRKGKLATHKSAAQRKKNQTKNSAALSHRDLLEEKMTESESVLFTEESVVTQLFPEGTATNSKANPSADKKKGSGVHKKKEAATNKKKSSFQTPHMPDTLNTPSSVIQNAQSFTKLLSDSGDEFQVSTPKSTPRLASWRKQKPSQSQGSQDKSPAGCLKLTDVINACRPEKRTAPARKKGSSEHCSHPVDSGDGGDQSSPSLPAENKPPPTLGKKNTSRTRGATRQSKAATEALQQNPRGATRRGKAKAEALQQSPAKLDPPSEVGDTCPGMHSTGSDVVEGSCVPAVADKASVSSERGRRGRGKPLSTDTENTGAKAAPARKRQAKILSPVNVIPSEPCHKQEEKSEEAMNPVVEADDALHSKRGGNQKEHGLTTRRTRQTKSDQSLESQKQDTLQPETGRKSTSRKGRQYKAAEKAASELTGGRKSASKETRKEKIQSMPDNEVVPERELVRGDNPQDVFDFVESDGETESSQTSTRKASRKGRPTKTPAAKSGMGRNSKKSTGRTASSKTVDKSSLPSAVKHKAVPNTPASSLSTKHCTAVTKDKTDKAKLTENLASVKQPSETGSKGASFTNTVSASSTDFSSIETLRMGHLAAAFPVAEVKDILCESFLQKGLPGRNDVQQSQVSQDSVWHLETYLPVLQRCDNDTYSVMDSLAADLENVVLEDSEKALHKADRKLRKCVARLHHFPPVALFSEASKLSALITLRQGGDPWDIAAVLCESKAVSLRHQFLALIQKNIRLMEMEGVKKCKDMLLEKNRDMEQLVFPWDAQQHQQAVQNLPQGWTVCQFTVMDSPGSPTLLLTRLTSDQDPFTVELPHFSDETGQAIYFGFMDILKVNDEVSKIKDNTLWWRYRASLDAKLANLLEGMESHWLGPWRGLLAAQTSNTAYNTTMDTAATNLLHIVHTCLGHQWSHGKARQALELLQHSTDLPTILSRLLQRDDIADNTQLLEAITTKVIEVMPKVTDGDLPVILILDKHLSNFPLEQLSVMRSQAVTRVPSLPLLHLLLRQHNVTGGGPRSAAGKDGTLMERGVDPTSVFYMMNPDGDLIKSQQFLEPFFNSNKKWKGMAGCVPTKEQFQEALTQYDIFTYCGHGNGCKYFSPEDLLRTRCQTVPLLFGCGSVRLDVFQHLDAEGYVHNYLLAGAPCVLGNLWDVTDRDIDTFAKEIFNLWQRGDHRRERHISLASLVQQARSVCRMKLLNGGAPVLYGLPVPLQHHAC
ncbi:uncharacterized protein LOC143276416 [Babylonia areolata]|uniref:uncharacterized protein LOC143276416 n=1 Tax=Babylonia areolata TaxID=304850 RepID=UPI003FD392DE